MRISPLLCICSILLLNACKKDSEEPKTFTGTPVTIGNGTARTFVTLNNNSQPTTIGIRMTADALTGLPSSGMVPGYMLTLPPEAQQSGFDHSEIDWNPEGHEPLFAYGVPHFDFHFYLVTEQEQAAVIPGPDTVPVEPQFVPRDYVSGIMAVPDMGTHWSDTTSLEFHGQPFTATFIYGFYQGNMTFLEPMITKAFLESKTDTVMQIKQPQAYQKHGFYPTQVHLSFDNQSQEYVIAMEDLTYQ